MQGRAYSAVKSKVSKNIRVIEKVKKTGSPVKPAPGYDPNFKITETLRKTKTKGRPQTAFVPKFDMDDDGPSSPPKVDKDHI